MRSRHDLAPIAYKTDFLERIKQRERAAGNDCDDARALEIFETGRKNGWIKWHFPSKAWRGGRQPEPERIQVKQLKSVEPDQGPALVLELVRRNASVEVHWLARCG